jgi:ubiquinone/menaquinone biosynthesis C-methylase UbiE
MGLIFDKNIAEFYESWYHSPHGRAIDRSIERLIVALLDPRPGERILDIGCGAGNHLITFSRLGLDVSGIDASSYMIQKARERLGHRCTLRTGLAEDLPFEDNEFDLAVMINTMEFLDNPLIALREAGRVANKKVFIGVINSLSWNGLVRRIQGYFGDPLFGRSRFYNLWQLKSFLREAYGPAPLSWACIKIHPAFIEDMKSFEKTLKKLRHSPFGSFLGISATMTYRVKADGLPLRIKMEKPSRSFIGAGSLSHLKRSKGVHADERGIPV